MRSIVDRIRPSLEGLAATDLQQDPEALMQHAARANVRVAAGYLRHGSGRLEQMIQSKGLLVVGAEYSLASGNVDGVPG